MKNAIFSAILALCLLTSGTAFAVCTAPAGVAGEIEYMTDSFFYCDNTNWIDMKYDALSSGLVGHWKLDETTGENITDSSVNGNDGIWSDDADILTPDSVAEETVTGRVDTGAIDFDGTGAVTADRDHIDAPATNLLGVGFTEMTASAWVQVGASNNNNARILTYKTDAQNKFTIRLDNDPSPGANIGAYVESSNIEYNVNPAVANVITDAGWHHVLFTFTNGNTTRVYVDNVKVAEQVGTKTGGSILAAANDIVYIGVGDYATATHFFDGVIDDVRIYDRALNLAEIADLYNNTITPCTAAGQMYYDSGAEVYKFCDGTEVWPVAPDGAGGAGCSTPTAVAGAMNYNAGTNKMQFCDGTSWIDID